TDNSPPPGVPRRDGRASAHRGDRGHPAGPRAHAVTLTELVELPAGSFPMGSTDFYPEEAPVRTVSVGAFAIDRHPVTNAQFAEFVSATGHVTIAEQKPDPMLYPGASPDDLTPGALVFRATPGPVNLRDWRQWWAWVPGAYWRRPFGS